MRVEIDDDPAALDRVAARWSSLRARLPHATVFQDPAWLVPWYAHLGGAPLRLVTVWDGQRLAALAPLQCWTDPNGVRLLLLLGTGVTDYGDVLFEPDAAAALHDAIASLACEADCARFEALRPEAALWSIARGCASGDSDVPCLVRRLDAEWTKRARRRVVLWRNRAERRGAVAFEFAREPATIERAIASLVQLHTARWQSRGEDGVLAEAALARFHHDVALRAHAAGLLRLATLSIGGRVVAVQYGFSDGRIAAGYLTGMDPDFAFESPGSLLTHLVLEAAREEGCREFHFLRGDEPYKQMFADETRWNRHLEWTPTSASPT